MWVRCPRCRELTYSREWESSFKVCAKCGYNAPLSVKDRIALLLDDDSFLELDAGMRSGDPLQFEPPGRPSYREKLTQLTEESGVREACVYGRGRLDGIPVVFGVLDMSFFAGTLGSVVGEKITRACELARDERRPLIICSASGGARQQEGSIALLQMAKTAAAVRALGRTRVPYVSLLTDPTLAGVTASFAALGDCIIAEPGAMVGFAGRRLIEQATGEKLPPSADTAEFQFEHGMVDMVVLRRDLRAVLVGVLRLFLDATGIRPDGSTTQRALPAPAVVVDEPLPAPVVAG